MNAVTLARNYLAIINEMLKLQKSKAMILLVLDYIPDVLEAIIPNNVICSYAIIFWNSEFQNIRNFLTNSNNFDFFTG